MGDMSLYHAIHCALGGAPMMTIALVIGGLGTRLIAGLIGTVRATVRSLSLTFDRSRHIFLSNVMERAACIRTPTSCKERSTSSS